MSLCQKRLLFFFFVFGDDLLLHTSNQISLIDDVNNNKRPASVVFFQSKRALLKSKAYLNKSDRRAPRARRRLSAKRVNAAAAKAERERGKLCGFLFFFSRVLFG